MISRPITASQASARLVSARGPRLASRLRFQLGGGLVFAIFVPLQIWLALIDEASLNTPALQTLVASIIALVLGSWQFRSISQFPGVEASLNIFSSFSLSFGLVGASFLLLRLEYVRSIFLWSYGLSIVWFYLTYWILQRRRRIRIGFVPGAYARSLHEVDGISWLPLELGRSTPTAVDAIVADFRETLAPEWERMIAEWSISGTPVYSKKHLLESLTGEVEIEHLSENQFGSLIPASAYLRLKGLLDRCVALVVLPLLAPIMILVAIMIRLETPGPAIFRQQRMGFRGQPFTVLKFRTMTADPFSAEDERSIAITQQNDQRITRLGRFLRTSRIDELPQIINVLRGEMSWIGPRPEAVPLSRWYEAELPFYRYRHIVRPGITGWAQVNQGHVADVESVQKKLNYDFYYIKYFSPWLDMLIVARTIRTILTGFGSR
jgi:lipopolysaccharide/colanic/teichoic acid biosynthesis glycosyltransferase